MAISTQILAMFKGQLLAMQSTKQTTVRERSTKWSISTYNNFSFIKFYALKHGKNEQLPEINLQLPGPNVQCLDQARRDLRVSEWTGIKVHCSHISHLHLATKNLSDN